MFPRGFSFSFPYLPCVHSVLDEDVDHVLAPPIPQLQLDKANLLKGEEQSMCDANGQCNWLTQSKLIPCMSMQCKNVEPGCSDAVLCILSPLPYHEEDKEPAGCKCVASITTLVALCNMRWPPQRVARAPRAPAHPWMTTIPVVSKGGLLLASLMVLPYLLACPCSRRADGVQDPGTLPASMTSRRRKNCHVVLQSSVSWQRNVHTIFFLQTKTDQGTTQFWAYLVAGGAGGLARVDCPAASSAPSTAGSA